MFRLDEKTYKNLTIQSKKKSLTKAKFLRKLINERVNLHNLKNIEKIHTLNSKMYLDISKVTNNMNQIAYKLNTGNFDFNEQKLYTTAEELKYLIKQVLTCINKDNNKLKNLL
ncbi:MAG: hypothetical protein JJV94_08450 [Sulfurospirillum sp.]|nr:hypothetical protein [Sulfurospirillum sp.]